ncbi:MAG: dihydrofolate reductase [Rubrivivax sp.]
MSAAAGSRPRGIVLVAAVARDGAIGRGNALLWSDPADLRHFRHVTAGHPVVMGRKTWDSLPTRFRPLPGRRNVVLSRNPDWRADGAERVADFASALELLGDAETVCVIGGAQVYSQALPMATRLDLTEIDASFDNADTYFPALDLTVWRETSRQTQCTADGVRFDFVSLVPRTAPGTS